MASIRESSLLFSLKQFTTLEEIAQRRADVTLYARDDALRAEQESSMRARLEAERKAREDAEVRAMDARIEAIRVAAVERARSEAEASARAEAIRVVQEHQQALAAIKEDGHKYLFSSAVRATAIGAAFVLVATVGAYYGKVKPDADARRRAQQAEISAASEEAKRLRGELAERDERIKRAEKALQQMRDAEAAKGGK